MKSMSETGETVKEAAFAKSESAIAPPQSAGASVTGAAVATAYVFLPVSRSVRLFSSAYCKPPETPDWSVVGRKFDGLALRAVL